MKKNWRWVVAAAASACVPYFALARDYYSTVPAYFKSDAIGKALPTFEKCWTMKTFNRGNAEVDRIDCLAVVENTIQSVARRQIARRDRPYVLKELENQMVIGWYNRFPKRNVFHWGVLFPDAENLSNACYSGMFEPDEDGKVRGSIYESVNCVNKEFAAMAMMYVYMNSDYTESEKIYNKLIDCLAPSMNGEAFMLKHLEACVRIPVKDPEIKDKDNIRFALDAMYYRARKWIGTQGSKLSEGTESPLDARVRCDSTGEVYLCALYNTASMLSVARQQAKEGNNQFSLETYLRTEKLRPNL